MKSPTQNSLKKLRSEGWLAEVTEHWNPFARRRVDLLGFIDILAVRGNTVLAVQTTSAANIRAREKKIRELPAHKVWLASPNRAIVVHGWKKVKGRWECRELGITDL